MKDGGREVERQEGTGRRQMKYEGERDEWEEMIARQGARDEGEKRAGRWETRRWERGEGEHHEQVRRGGAEGHGGERNVTDRREETKTGS